MNNKMISPGDLIKWPDDRELYTVSWISSCGRYFMVRGIPARMRTSDNFELIHGGRLDVPD
jgi:hypothetical protein